jgi:hypothetical protein
MCKAIKVLVFVAALVAYAWGVLACCDWLTKPAKHRKLMQSQSALARLDRLEIVPISHGVEPVPIFTAWEDAHSEDWFARESSPHR